MTRDLCVFVQSHRRGQTQPNQHHRVQSPGRVEWHAGVHLQQRRNQNHRHVEAPGHQEEAAGPGAAGQDGVQVTADSSVDPLGGRAVREPGLFLFRRRLWQHVTKALKEGNMDKATEHKHRLEENQRGEERQRAADNRPWTPKHFTKEVKPRPPLHSTHYHRFKYECSQTQTTNSDILFISLILTLTYRFLEFKTFIS